LFFSAIRDRPTVANCGTLVNRSRTSQQPEKYTSSRSSILQRAEGP